MRHKAKPMQVCKHCGLQERDHCIFDPKDIPPGCQCNPMEWNDKIPPPCKKYVGNGETNCETCEHDKACHHGA